MLPTEKTDIQLLTLTQEEIDEYQDGVRAALAALGRGDVAERVLPPKVEPQKPKPKILEW